MGNGKRRVVITGLGCTTSLGLDIQSFWASLLKKTSGISRITKFDPSEFRCQIAGEIKNLDTSPWISNRDKKKLDPFSIYALISAQQAITDSGIDSNTEDCSKMGVILGSGMGGLNEIEVQQEVIKQRGPNRISPFALPKFMVNAAAAEISIRYNLQGPSFIVASACASSAQALAVALRTIQYGDADVIVCGGAEAIITPLSIGGFCATRALSQRNDEPQRASRPFDKDRDGFVMGEGAAILVLEEMERAKKRGAKIYGEFCGAAWNSDAHHITQPKPDAEIIAKTISNTLKDAEINAQQVSYINAHGTSTQQNDPIETRGIKKAFGEYAKQIPISSTKSMLGHLVGASGAIEALVCCLSIQKNQVHSTMNLDHPDPECDLDYIPQSYREIPVNYAISNSFGFGGHNVCLAFGKHPS